MPRPDSIDIQFIFRVYASVAATAGLLLAGWGPMWFGRHLPEHPFGRAALIRIAGAALVAAACCAAGFAAAGGAMVRRSLGWFLAAHVFVAEMVIVQRWVALGVPLADPLNLIVFTITIVLGYLWMTSDGEVRSVAPGEWSEAVSLLHPKPQDDSLRARYEQHIREAAGQAERNRLARELHDAIKQQLFVIQTAAATAQTRFDDDRAGARQSLDQVRAAARDAIAEMEAMLDQLRAVPLENTSLIDALRKQCEALEHRTGAAVDFTIGNLPESHAMPPGAQRAIFRIAQEALSNIGRHARARHVSLALSSAAGELSLRVTDDGEGFDDVPVAAGMGIRNMQERASELGGSLDVVSRKGDGSTVTFAMPIRGESLDFMRHTLRSRAGWWGVVLAAAGLSLALGGLDLSLPIAAVAAIGVARNLIAARRMRVHANECDYDRGGR